MEKVKEYIIIAWKQLVEWENENSRLFWPVVTFVVGVIVGSLLF